MTSQPSGLPDGTDASRKRKLNEENEAPTAPKHAHVVDQVLPGPSIQIATGDAAAVKKVQEKEESSSSDSSSSDDDSSDDSSDDDDSDDSDDSDVSVSSSEGNLPKPGEK